MKKLQEILSHTFKKQIFDDTSKKEFKQEAKNLNIDHKDLNLIVKNAFDLYRDNQNSDKDIFLINWLQTVVNIANDLKTDEKKIIKDIKFSPIDKCQQGIIDFINEADSNIKICVFTISDNNISRKIIQKFRNGVDVKIITDNEKLYDKGSDIMEFAKIGIKVKVDKTKHHMHHKFAVVDSKILLTGSYNWTRTANLYNQENFITLEDNYTVKKYLKEFNRLWKISAPFSV